MTTTGRLLATSTRVLRHTVRVVHTTTGRPVRGLAAHLEPVPRGWGVRVLPDAVAVVATTDVPAPAPPPVLVVTLTDASVADLLVVPPVAGRPPRTFVVPLTAAKVDVPVHPVKTTLTVVLATASTGAPRTGRTVTARATSGPTPRPSVALPEVSPGTYRSAAVEWTAALNPADVLVNGTLLRTLPLDLTRPATTVHLVDTS